MLVHSMGLSEGSFFILLFFFTGCFIEAVRACFSLKSTSNTWVCTFLIQQRIGKGSALLCQMTLVAAATPELPATPANSQNSQVRV